VSGSMAMRTGARTVTVCVTWLVRPSITDTEPSPSPPGLAA
jgi:hypothetical protein